MSRINKDNCYEFEFLDKLSSDDLSGLKLTIPVEAFSSYILLSIKTSHDEAYMGNVYGYLKVRNKLIQYVQAPFIGANNSFSKKDCIISADKHIDEKRLILRPSQTKASTLFQESVKSWRFPLRIRNSKGTYSLFVTDGFIRKNKDKLLYMLALDDNGYNAILLRSGRYEELARRATLDQIRELISLGTIEPFHRQIIPGSLQMKPSGEPICLDNSRELLSKIKKLH